MRAAIMLLLLMARVGAAQEDCWPQFRGPNGAGVARGSEKLPVEISPDKNVLWHTPLPPGHSSPVVCGGRVFLTAVRDKTLLTIALDAADGRVLWEQPAPYDRLEDVHQIGNRAQPSPATDGKIVISFFGSCGLFGYDAEGHKLWHVAMGPFKNDFGAGSSPILVGDRVILNQDHDTDSALMCFDKHDGRQLWKADRSEFPRSYATPIIWQVEGKSQIVVPGTLRVMGYDLETGQDLWTVGGLSRLVNMTPVVGEDNTLYVAGWAAGGDAEDRIRPEPFADLIAKQDANKNGVLELSEIPEGPFQSRFPQIDRDKDGQITEAEWETMRAIFEQADNAIVAIRPGGQGNVTATHVLWKQRKFLPYIPSPLYYKDALFMVKDGGILSTLDVRTGKPIKQGRASGNGDYYASPVVGDGKVYLFSEEGEMTVISAEGQWQVLATAKFNEQIHATPAIVGGHIFVRTAGQLYCFGSPAP
jgi:outer membrane protein assembly factor BamB